MNNQERPLILVTNDDGISAPGIRELIRILNEVGDVFVVAPDTPQSGMGHAITVNNTLFVEPVNIDEGPQVEYACSGTPADCVKLAVNELLNKRPAICVSGINHGSNSSINVIYSGTMSAALEAGIEGIPGIGFSLLEYSWNADFSHVKEPILKIVRSVLERGLPEGVVLNVNIPKKTFEPLRGIKVCRQAKAFWKEEFDKRVNPHGREYYWLTGEFVNLDKGEDTDVWALEHNYVSIVPIHYDMTAHHFIKNLNDWSL